MAVMNMLDSCDYFCLVGDVSHALNDSLELLFTMDKLCRCHINLVVLGIGWFCMFSFWRSSRDGFRCYLYEMDCFFVGGSSNELSIEKVQATSIV